MKEDTYLKRNKYIYILTQYGIFKLNNNWIYPICKRTWKYYIFLIRRLWIFIYIKTKIYQGAVDNICFCLLPHKTKVRKLFEHKALSRIVTTCRICALSKINAEFRYTRKPGMWENKQCEWKKYNDVYCEGVILLSLARNWNGTNSDERSFPRLKEIDVVLVWVNDAASRGTDKRKHRNQIDGWYRITQ